MPEISRFYGLIIKIFFRQSEHNPPQAMYHRISSVKPLGGLEIEATFRDGSVKRYDAAPLLELHPAFRALRDVPGLFNLVHVDVSGYGVAWNDDIDLDAEDIWAEGIPVAP